MKYSIVAIIALIVTACNAGNASESTNVSAVSTQATNTTIATKDTSTKQEPSTVVSEATAGRNVKYYYNKMANVQGPEGSAELTIVKEDIKAGIITYKEAGNDKVLKIQVWNKAGYDIIDFVGSIYVSIKNAEPKALDGLAAADAIAKAVGDQRSARGGECTYNQHASYSVTASGVIEALLKCSDDDTIQSVIGTVTVANGKLKVTKK